MGRSKTTSLLLAFAVLTTTGGIGATNVLCVEADGRISIERLFDCWLGGDGDCGPDACDACTDVPLQSPGHNSVTQGPRADLRLDSSADLALPVDVAIVRDEVSALGDATIHVFSVNHPVTLFSVVLRC